MVQFTLTTTAGIFTALVLLVVVGTIMSPMATGTVAMVNVGLAVFGVVALVLGIKHGEWRATAGR